MTHAIIDKTGLPNGFAYYSMYRSEPSIHAGWDMRLNAIDGIASITLEKVLQSVRKATANDMYNHCPDVLLVCHGRSDELIMPLAAGSSKHATRNALEVLIHARRLLDRLPEKREEWTEPAWLGFLKGVQEPTLNLVKQTAKNLKEAKTALEQVCVAEFGVGSNKFFGLMKDLGDVQKSSPSKLEIRACNFGKSDSLLMLELLGKLFNTPLVVAPKRKTMYAPVLLPAGKRARDEAALEQLTKQAGGRFFIEKGFAIRIKKIDPELIQFASDAGTVSDTHTIAWLQRHIHKNPQQAPGFTPNRFLVTGLWDETEQSKLWPFTTPLNPAYRQLLVMKQIRAADLAHLSTKPVDWSRARRVPA